jgi:hypothetical protein
MHVERRLCARSAGRWAIWRTVHAEIRGNGRDPGQRPRSGATAAIRGDGRDPGRRPRVGAPHHRGGAEAGCQPPPLTVPLPVDPEPPLVTPLPDVPLEPEGAVECGGDETGGGDDSGGGDETGGEETGGEDETGGAYALAPESPPVAPALTTPELEPLIPEGAT